MLTTTWAEGARAVRRMLRSEMHAGCFVQARREHDLRSE